MSLSNIPLRHELKYHVTPAELSQLRGILDPLLERDPNGDENNRYHIALL